LLVGDEPPDIVFARGRAYVTTAHRGQNKGRDPQLTTPGVGRADVWGFDPANLCTSLERQAVTVLPVTAANGVVAPWNGLISASDCATSWRSASARCATSSATGSRTWSAR
jgi:hypothetical protein